MRLPIEASQSLPTRAMCSVEGTFGGTAFWTTLLPDGEGGHWMKVEKKLQSKAKPGDTVEVEIAPMAKEPEPTVPLDLKKALKDAPPKATETWNSITAMARRDWCFWVVSVATDKMSKGNRRPCCFDRSQGDNHLFGAGVALGAALGAAMVSSRRRAQTRQGHCPSH